MGCGSPGAAVVSPAEDLTRYSPSGTVHPMDMADLALARWEITKGDAKLVREGVLTLERARSRKKEKPRGGWPEDNALARAQISPDSYRAVLREEITLAQAKERGRQYAEPEPTLEPAPAESWELGAEVWMRARVVQGAEGLPTAVPYVEGKMPHPQKRALKGVFAHKAELRQDVPA